jgi:hypothetical protein
MIRALLASLALTLAAPARADDLPNLPRYDIAGMSEAQAMDKLVERWLSVPANIRAGCIAWVASMPSFPMKYGPLDRCIDTRLKLAEKRRVLGDTPTSGTHDAWYCETHPYDSSPSCNP